jgi:hypothetical protein
MTAGGAAVYTTVSCVVESNRDRKDWLNPASGGAVTGALVLGLKKQSLVAAVLGAAIFGFGAAAPEMYAPYCLHAHRTCYLLTPSYAALLCSTQPAVNSTNGESL